MDPVSAIGLAANVLQLLDFGSKLLFSGCESYKSQDGMNLDNAHVEEYAKSLQSISRKLEQASHIGETTFSSLQAGLISTHDAGLRDLAAKSQALAQDLLRLLERVRGKTKRFRTWAAVRSAFSASWNNDEIQAMRKRLMEIQCLINTRLLSLIQSDQMSLMLEIETSITTAGIMHQENLTELGAVEDKLISTIRSLGTQVSTSLQRMTERYDSEHDSAIRCYEESLARLTTLVDSLSSKLETWDKTTLILDSLAFPEMDERYDRIEQPCERTFEWVFDANANPLPEWLRTGSGLFLISGKAGCGKSTMMKNIFRDPRTRAPLEQWARTHGRPLITARFFFWNSGGGLQKTHEGLLRSLLLQTLTHCRYLVPMILPQRWSMEDFRLSKTWSRQELSDAIARLSEQNEARMPCYCFFIDGLDEYQGKMRCLVDDLCRLITSPYIKVCAASRPRHILDRGFREKSELVLHEYTRSDMRTFVEKRLVDDAAFRDLVHSNPEAWRIVRTIQDSAEGVFLWVFLIVQDLLRELDEYGTLEELEDRLRTLPPDLFHFFRRIIESIEQPYKQNVARLLLLLDEAEAPIPLMAVHFLYQDTKDQRYVLSADLEVHALDISEDWALETRRQLKKWCRDLIDVDVPGWTEEKGGPEVQFSHQSMRDYVRLPEVQEYLTSLADKDFDAAHTLCRLSLAHLRVALCNLMETSKFDPIFSNLLNRVMYSAISYEHKTGCTPGDLLKRLDESCTTAFKNPHSGSHLSPRTWPPQHSLAVSQQTSLCAFLGFVARCGLANFVRAEIGLALDNGEGAYILDSALRPHSDFQSALSRAGRLDIIRFLLTKGVNPNDRVKTAHHGTVWERFLQDAWSWGEVFFPAHEFLHAVEMCLDSGANPYAHCASRVDRNSWRGRLGLKNINIQSILPEILNSEMYSSAVIEHRDTACRISSAHGILMGNTSQTQSWIRCGVLWWMIPALSRRLGQVLIPWLLYEEQVPSSRWRSIEEDLIFSHS